MAALVRPPVMLVRLYNEAERLSDRKKVGSLHDGKAEHIGVARTQIWWSELTQ